MPRLAAVLLFALVCTAGAWQSYADKANLVTVSAAQQHQDPTLVLTLGKAEIVKVDGPVADVLVANPSIVDVQALQSNQLYMVGAAIGDTNIIVLDAEGNTLKRMNIHVRIDEITLQNNINSLFPDERDVRAKTVNNQVVLTGRVSTPDASNKIQDLAARIAGNANNIANLMKVQGDQQVMLKVKIMEMARSSLREIGTDFQINYLGGDTNLVLNPNVGAGLTSVPRAIGGFVFNNDDFAPLSGALRLLEDEGLVSILAEPNLSAISGEQAGFLAGGEFPVPTSLDENGNLVVTYRQFGVSLNFRPIVMSNDRISLQIQTEVSSLDRANAVAGVGGLSIPALDVRRASTTVEMGSGASLMIAGIMQSQTVKTMQGLPGIKDTPVIGDLIKSRSFDRDETELVVMVTPFMVRPFADTTQVKKADVPPPEKRAQNNLSQVFADNLRRTYANKRKLPEDLMSKDQSFGYLMP
jgi:pilus assembly protein CpaC